MRNATSVLALVAAGCLAACQPGSPALPAETALVRTPPVGSAAPTTPPAPMAGVLVPPLGSIPMPGWAVLSAPSTRVVWAVINSAYLYRSKDEGGSWEQRPLPPAVHPEQTTAIAFVNDLEGWLLASGAPETQCNGAGADVWHTTDGGMTWARISSVDQEHPDARGLGYAQCKGPISFVDPLHGYIGAWDENRRPTMFRTSDGGRSWAASTLPDPPGFTTMSGGFTLQPAQLRGFGGTLLVAARCLQATCGGAYVFRSTDGVSWSFAAGAPQPQVPVTFISASHWIQLIGPGQSTETTDAGQTWHASPSGYSQAAPFAPVVVFGDSSVGYATARGEIQRTLDGGMGWTMIKTPGVV